MSAEQMKSCAVLVTLCLASAANAYQQSEAEKKLYLEKVKPLQPLLVKEIERVWPELGMRSFLPAMIEQETCSSAKSSKCFNSKAELKTAREYGFGLSMATIAYRADGTERFNTWKELTALDPVLKRGWTWDNRYDPAMQMRAMVLKNLMNYSSIRFNTANTIEKMAFTAVTYNSGSPLIDRNICLRQKGCDPSKWFDNVELYTKKSMIPQKGYGKSFAEISREYPRNVIFIRRDKYVPLLGN